MDRLLSELIESGMLDERSADWACEYQAQHGVALDSALLELELVDEEGLLRALASVSNLQVADPADLFGIDPALATRLPFRLAKAFAVCPIRLEGAELASLVLSPLADEVVQELHDLFGLQVRQLLVPSHHLQVAQSRLYGKALDARSQAIENLLARRRQRPDMRRLLERIVATPGQAAVEVLDYVVSVLEFSCLLLVRPDALHVIAARGSPVSQGTNVPAPDSTCALAAALRYGGYFLGPLLGTDAEQLFYRGFERPVPAWAFVAPVPVRSGVSAVICADNGPRGIAKRWIAEITLLAARLGQQATGKGSSVPAASAAAAAPAPTVVPSSLPVAATPPAAPAPAPTEGQASEPAPPGEAPLPSAASAPTDQLELTAAEAAAVQRLRMAGAEEGKSLDAFVEELLRQHRAPAKEANALVDEVRGLFEKLATDIPTHLGRGMEAAFRDLVPRMVGAIPVSAPAPRPSGPTPAAAVELVQTQAAPREPTDYRALRARSKRTKL